VPICLNLHGTFLNCVLTRGTHLKGNDYIIRSYELGILFHKDSFPGYKLAYKPNNDGKSVYIPVPYDIPLTKYKTGDSIWRCDIPLSKPDVHGLTI
jgi:hypothetical protein